MHPSYSYESQLPALNAGVSSFGQVGSFGQTVPLTGSAGVPQPPNHYVSAATYQGPGYGNPKAQGDCEDECAEEECDPDQCGDEQRGPDVESRPCGIDTRPLLPIGLVGSTFLSGVCMMLCQLPVINSLIGGFEFVLGMFIAIFLILYLITLGCMLYCIVADPGSLKPEYAQSYAEMVEVQARQGQARPAPKMPKRTQKTWLYRQPVRRYDHYCRWVTNCIGLLNHREFFIMVVGINLLSVLCTAIDLVSVIAVFSKPNWAVRILVLAHLMYSVVILALAAPILKVHFGLVTRNELASEWKRNDYYVVAGRNGELIAVNNLSDDEFNDRFDSFTYDKTRNPWDKGCMFNCRSFWFTPRWQPNQMGEF